VQSFSAASQVLIRPQDVCGKGPLQRWPRLSTLSFTPRWYTLFIVVDLVSTDPEVSTS
jgi:hypothetical protein